jgi:hypothetical protein
MNQQRRIFALKNSPYASIIRNAPNWNAILLNKDNSPNIVPIKFWGISIDTVSAKINWVPLDCDCNSYYTKSNFVCISHIVDLNQSMIDELQNKCNEKAKQLT